MLPVYIGAYIFILAVLWWFFLIARHHSYKFKNFSQNVVPVTNILFVFLIVLSVLGFILILTLDAPTQAVKIDTDKKIYQNYY